MAKVRRTNDRSNIWLKHVDDPDNSVLTTLNRLEARQEVTLSIAGRIGKWRRFDKQPDGKVPFALSSADHAAKEIWNSLAVDTRLSIEVVEVGSISPEAGRNKRRQKRQPVPSAPTDAGPRTHFRAALPFHQVDNRAVLCIGLDFAWHGGSANNARSKSDTLAYALVDGSERWSPLWFKRVKLTVNPNAVNDRFTANSDPDASEIANAISNAIDEARQYARTILACDVEPDVVLAIDVPIKAMQPPNGDRSRDPVQQGTGLLRRRQCDESLSNAKSQGGMTEWNDLCVIQPGAPLSERTRLLVDKLNSFGFASYPEGLLDGSRDEPATRKLVIECFPGESLWSAGLQGWFHNLDALDVIAYKRTLPNNGQIHHSELIAGALRGLSAFARLAPCWDAYCQWMGELTQEIMSDQWIVENDLRGWGRAGKPLDDLVESTNAFFVALAFARSDAHVWMGEHPQDGHIIGPGNPPE